MDRMPALLQLHLLQMLKWCIDHPALQPQHKQVHTSAQQAKHGFDCSICCASRAQGCAATVAPGLSIHLLPWMPMQVLSPVLLVALQSITASSQPTMQLRSELLHAARAYTWDLGSSARQVLPFPMCCAHCTHGMARLLSIHPQYVKALRAQATAPACMQRALHARQENHL